MPEHADAGPLFNQCDEAVSVCPSSPAMRDLQCTQLPAHGAVLVLPLYIPVLIFGAGAVSAAAEGGAVNGILAILGALLALTVSLGPLAVAAGLKISSGN